MTLLDFWPPPGAFTACAPPDAATLPTAVLVAVHQPARLTRGAESADERAVLDALLAPAAPVVVPVVGAGGSGKTHLLRWLALHLPAAARVVTVSGADDLTAVLAAEGLSAPAPPPALDEAAATELLLEGVRAALRERTAAARAACDAAVKAGGRPPPDERAVAETHGDGLAALLAGPTKEALFRDTPKRKSAFRAMVKRVATGVADPDAERFEPVDFEFPDVNSARLADPKAQRYVAKLKTNLQNERATAAALLNAARDAALVALPAPAAAAVPDGPEVILLIDDGEPAMLDALAAAGEWVRAIVALRDAPAGSAFVLNSPDVVELTGAYLNAARLGTDRLEAWFEATDRDPDAAPPVFSADLSAEDRAVLEAHGSPAQGYSLFPLMPEVLAELTGDRPTPRRLIGEVLPAALATGREAFVPAEPTPIVPEPEPVVVAPEPEFVSEPEPAPESELVTEPELVAEPETVAAPEPEPVPVAPTPEPVPVVAPALGALAVVLGRLPAPAPDDVVRFLVAAHTTGASLVLLTPGVVEWLYAHDQAAGFRVSGVSLQ